MVPGSGPQGASKMLTKWSREKLVKKCFKNDQKMLPGEAREHLVPIFEAFFDHREDKFPGTILWAFLEHPGDQTRGPFLEHFLTIGGPLGFLVRFCW